MGWHSRWASRAEEWDSTATCWGRQGTGVRLDHSEFTWPRSSHWQQCSSASNCCFGVGTASFMLQPQTLEGPLIVFILLKWLSLETCLANLDVSFLKMTVFEGTVRVLRWKEPKRLTCFKILSLRSITFISSIMRWFSSWNISRGNHAFYVFPEGSAFKHIGLGPNKFAYAVIQEEAMLGLTFELSMEKIKTWEGLKGGCLYFFKETAF